MSRYTLLSICLFFCFSCNHKEELESTVVDKDEYLKAKKVLATDSVVTLKYFMANNPYGFNDSDILLIYFNHQLAYVNNYSPSGDVKFKRPKDNEIIQYSIEVIRKDKLFIISSKSVFNWVDSFRYIYICHFPDNKETEEMLFFPHQYQVVR